MKKNRFTVHKTILVYSIFLFVFICFKPITAYFSQDDFYHLRTIMDRKLTDIPAFFTTWQEGQTFYRPISRETFNLVMYKIFGLNPLPFHIVNLFLIILIGLFSYKLIFKLTNSQLTANIFIFLYLLSPIHSIELYYLASIQTLLSTFFLIIATYFYFNFLNNKSIKNIVWIYVLFVFALLSHGIAVIFPAIVVSLVIFLQKDIKSGLNKMNIVAIGLFIVIDVLYIVYSALFSLPQQESYRAVLSMKSLINTISWYTLWSFGLPEMLADFIGPKLSVNPNLIKWYGTYIITVLCLLFVVIFTLSLLVRKKWCILFDRISLFSVSLFLFGLAPFAVFPNHKFVYYLSFSIVWFSTFLAYVFSQGWKNKNRVIKHLTILSMFCLIFISYSTVQINSITHWSSKRAAAAEYLLADIKNKYPKVNKDTVFLIKDDPKYPDIAKEWGSSSRQAFYILSGDDALKLLYKDKTIKAVFEGKNIYMGEVLLDQNTLHYEAKFPY